MSEQQRLEALWAGSFGNEYIARNRGGGAGRTEQWRAILDRWPARRVLEVGCNVGANMRPIVERGVEAWGVDINPEAIRELNASVPVAGSGVAPARMLPFRDGFFDLVFTAGVLIHQPAESLPLAMAEIVRCSSRWVLAAEYAAVGEGGAEEEVHYRGQSDALFRRDYGRIYLDLFPDLDVVDSWFVDDESWDRVTFWMLEKPS